jgi:nicotinamide phosphoribosyltransferase
MNALLQTDAYKLGHINQYPVGTELVYSNFTARSGKHSGIKGNKGIYFIGLQYFIKNYLIKEWNDTFFNQPKEKVVNRYKRFVDKMLSSDIDVTHIETLHDLGYLPITIKALPEGSFVKYKVPLLTVVNNKPEFFWLTNYIETVLSCELWLPCTSATSYIQFKKTSLKYSNETCDDNSFVPFQNHDFSMRGMQNRQSAAISGFASLACGSVGTDTLPAIELAEDYYVANIENELVGVSVTASEHSCQTAYGNENELESIRHLIEDVYPNGIFSMVSDSWDFWKLVTEHLPTLKDKIMQREGKLVIRPDSGDPVDIICGKSKPVIKIQATDYDDFVNEAVEYLEDVVREQTPHGEAGEYDISGLFSYADKQYYVQAEINWNRHDKQYYFIDGSSLHNIKEITLTYNPEEKGLIECLWDTFGGTINSKGYKVLDSHIGAIYGDSITLQRQETILQKLKDKGFASNNVVFGIGSFTYSFVTRDTHAFAFKSTYVKVNGEGKPIFKDPKTDDGTKKSAKGLLMVSWENGEYVLNDNVTPKQENSGCLEVVFKDGKLIKETTLAEIRKIVDESLV